MAQWFDLTATSKSQTVESLMYDWGFEYDPSDPYASAYKQIVSESNPDPSSSFYARGGNWELFCEMCLRARTLVFAEFKIGDCEVSAGPGAPSLAGELGIQAAETASSFIPVPGLGTAIGDIGGLLTGQHHQQAVAQERNILCAIVSQYGQNVFNLYESLASGTISPAQAKLEMHALRVSFTGAVSTITKQCNDACGLVGIMVAHEKFIAQITGAESSPGAGTLPIRIGSVSGSPWLILGIAAVVLLLIFLGGIA